MIIRSLQAENLLKYRHLRLDELPEQGVIAVSGDNESGKSAIGEIICFALFGRTYSLTADDLRKLVRWGATQGRVALRFSANDQELEIVRHVDRGGVQSARLMLRDQPEAPVARGVEAVGEYIERMLGYDFDEYIDTFYLAQREITTPHAHSPSVKAMAGLPPLEVCITELQTEIESDEVSVGRLEGRIAEIDEQLGGLSESRFRLEDLAQELAQWTHRERQLGARIGALDAAAEGYCDACRGLRSHAVRRGVASSLQFLFLLLVLTATGLWLLLRYQPELGPVVAIREQLEGYIATAGLPLDSLLFYSIIVLAWVLLLFWLWSFALNLGTHKRRHRARQLDEELRLLDELEPLQTRIGPQVDADALEAGGVALEQPAFADKPDSERRTRLADQVRILEARPEEVRAAARHEIAWMERGRKALTGEIEALTRTLDGARQDKKKEEQLQDERAGLVGQRDEHRDRIATRRLACELLQGALRRMADSFNEQLRNLVSRNLPRFTDGRYQYLQVGDDLQVRVYSNEKRSFLDLEEISSGTQRQIMLALRLALAQERMSRIAKDRQFAFLDEPFAFFDDTRMRGALRLLPELSDFITQHWVVAQRFPRDEFLALEIPCGGHPDTLEIGMLEVSRSQPG